MCLNPLGLILSNIFMLSYYFLTDRFKASSTDPICVFCVLVPADRAAINVVVV